MALSDIADVSISTVDPGVTQAGFGTVAILAYHTHWTGELVREYSSLTGMASDGFTSTEAAYKIASALFSQNPKVDKVKVIRRTTGSTQKLKITPTVQNSAEYSFVVVTPAGVEHEVTYTSDGSATAAEIIDALETAVEAITGSILTGTNDTTYLTVDAAAANTFYGFKDFTSNLTFEDITPASSPTLATQLDAAVLEDADWYALISASQGNPEIAALAAWTEANERLFFYSTAQTTARDSTSSNIGKTLKDASYARSVGMWSSRPDLHPEAGFAGRLLPYDPGSETWKFKTLNSVSIDTYTETQLGNLRSNNLNHYFYLAGKNITAEGKVAAGEFIDLVRFRDWFVARGREGIFGLLASQVKVAFDDIGITQVAAELWKVINQGLEVGAIARDPKPYVTQPAAADVPSADKSARHLPGITYGFTYTGAIHSAEASGTLRT